MSKHLDIVMHNDVCATVSGYGSRELIVELRGRPPMRSVAERGWIMQPHHARDLAVLAELRGWQVIITEAGGR